MCNLTKKYNGKSFTGYKVAYKKRKRYFSIATDEEYKEGKTMPDLSKSRRRTRRVGNFEYMPINEIINEKGFCFKVDMVGKTAVFKNKSDATDLLKNKNFAYLPLDKSVKLDIKLIVLKMTISGNLYEGKYGFNPVVAGEKIEKIEEI